MRMTYEDLRDIQHALKTGQLETISSDTVARLEADITDEESRARRYRQRVERETELAKQRFIRARDEFYRLHTKSRELYWKDDPTF